MPGFGFRVGFAAGCFVGWWLLEPPRWNVGVPLAGEAELGYRLMRRCWRQRFASEGCRELLRYAFEDLSLHRVFGLTMAVNIASRATMTAVGMHCPRTFPVDDDGPAGSERGGVEYQITRDGWCPDLQL